MGFVQTAKRKLPLFLIKILYTSYFRAPKIYFNSREYEYPLRKKKELIILRNLIRLSDTLMVLESLWAFFLIVREISVLAERKWIMTH